MKRFFYLGILILTVFSFCSCATIINSTSQGIEIKTNPPNAKLTIDGRKFGTTPQKVYIERKNNHVVRIELDGYDKYETQITSDLSFWFWGNIFNGLIPGTVIDLLTGSMYDLMPDSFSSELQTVNKTDPVTSKK